MLVENGKVERIIEYGGRGVGNEDSTSVLFDVYEQTNTCLNLKLTVK